MFDIGFGFDNKKLVTSTKGLEAHDKRTVATLTMD